MKIKVLPIVSQLHDNIKINVETKQLLDEIRVIGKHEVTLSNLSEFYDSDISLILIQSGGSEGLFLEMENNLLPPYYFLTYGSNNSLAASMEILSYLKSKGEKAEILHGTADYIVSRLNDIKAEEDFEKVNLGVIGAPSDWLIASKVDYGLVLKKLNIKLIDIEIDELVEEYNRVDIEDYENELVLDFDSLEVRDAKRVSKALNVLVNKYNLKGLTIRCFDLLGKIHTTGCLGLSLLNRDHMIGTCEGDIPSMLSMYFLNQVTGQPGFQANPSRIDTTKNEIVFAHCTLPIDMAQNYKAMTHFESGIGLGIRGEMKKTSVTLFKLSNNLKDYYVAEGMLVENLEEENLCRTQIKIKLEDVKYFLTAPYGNHHLIVYGRYLNKMKDFMNRIL